MDPFDRRVFAVLQFLVWVCAVCCVFVGAERMARGLGYLSAGLLLWVDLFLGKILVARKREET